jgi:hypothetical protein
MEQDQQVRAQEQEEEWEEEADEVEEEEIAQEQGLEVSVSVLLVEQKFLILQEVHVIQNPVLNVGQG